MESKENLREWLKRVCGDLQSAQDATMKYENYFRCCNGDLSSTCSTENDINNKVIISTTESIDSREAYLSTISDIESRLDSMDRKVCPSVTEPSNHQTVINLTLINAKGLMK